MRLSFFLLFFCYCYCSLLPLAARPPDSLRVQRLLDRSARYSTAEVSRAEAAADSAWQLARQLGWGRGQAQALNLLANSRVSAADWPAATRYAFQALKLARQLGDARSEAEALGQLSAIEYNQLVEYKEPTPEAMAKLNTAVRWGRESVAAARRVGPALLAAKLNSLGGILTEVSRFAEADSCLRLALAATQHAGLRAQLPSVYVNLGFNELMQNRREAATQAMNAAVREATADSGALTNALLARAQLWARLGRYGPAVADGQQALRLARAQGQTDLVRMLLTALPDYFEKLGRYPEALALERRRAALNDSVSSAEVRKQLADLNTRYKVAEQRQRIRQLTQQREQAVAQAAAQRARLRLLVLGVAALALALGVFAWFYRQLRRSRAELAASEAELRVANQTKDQLMSIVGHDLRGPMASFQQVGPLLVDLAEQPDPAELRQLGVALTGRARAVGALLDNLLDWARSQAGQVSALAQQTPPEPLLHHLAEVFTPLAAAKSVRLETDVAADLPVLNTDANLLRTVLRNLLANAVKFTPAGGTVWLRATACGPGRVRFEVADTGPGLTNEQLRRWQANEAVGSTRGPGGEKGTGLGLAVSRHFCKLLGGELRLLSPAGEGARWQLEV